MRPVAMSFFVLFVACFLSACGGSRQMGDIGGTPVEFTVDLERAFVSAMENRQGRLGASAGMTVGSGGTRTGLGFGLSFTSTTVYLYGGNAPGQANVFRKKISWGSNDFTIPMNVGRKVVFSVVVTGGRRGWESVGSYQVKEGDNAVHLSLVETGATIKTN